MKYYIPTTTLNFNNILSSESISPSEFFHKREFGYPRWFKIPENGLNNSILLYDSLARFEREESDLEDHPMIVEINTDEIFHEIEKGIYISDKTIYLSHWNTKFIFFNQQDKLVALSMSDSSLETKMVRLYEDGLEIHNPLGTYSRIAKDLQELNKSEVRHDRIINRLKGLMYGYYIGALLSSNQASVTRYNILKELKNIFASILSSPLRQPSVDQKERLKNLINSLGLELILEENKEILDDRELNNDEKAERVDKIYDTYYKSDTYKNLNPEGLLRVLRDGPLENNPALKWVAGAMEQHASIVNEYRKLLSPEKNELVVKDNKLFSIKESVITDETERKVFISLINRILLDTSINGKISSQRAEFSDILTGMARDVLGENWEYSPIRTYLNLLRRHVRGDEFNQTWDNGVLSSLAAVLLKGDDWDILLDFMKRKDMTDYRLAFAFYGVFHGFANLTRDFTDLLLSNEREYVESIYNEFHRSIHGESIVGTPNRLLPEQRVKRDTSLVTTIESSKPQTFKERVWSYYTSKIRNGSKNKKKLDKELLSALESIRGSEDGYVFVCVLNDYSLWGARSNAWKLMQQEFCPDYKTRRDPKYRSTTVSSVPEKSVGNFGIPTSSPSLFGGLEESDDQIFYTEISEPLSDSGKNESLMNGTQKVVAAKASDISTSKNTHRKSIIDDDDAIKHIELFLGVTTHPILSLFKKFQDSYRSGYFSKEPNKYQRNNSNVIDHFRRWILYNVKNKTIHDWTWEDGNKLSDLKDYLLQLYND